MTKYIDLRTDTYPHYFIVWIFDKYGFVHYEVIKYEPRA